MERVGSRLAVVQMGWGDPFGVAVFAFSGNPALGFNERVVGSAGQSERVDVGAMVVGQSSTWWTSHQ